MLGGPCDGKNYDLFLPPEELAVKPVKSWRKSEAKAYFHWMITSADSRVSNLLRYLDVSEDHPSVFLLEQVGSRLGFLLPVKTELSLETTDGRRLSNVGYAVAADAGLLVAKCLIMAGNGKIFWDILSKPKSAQSFNLPVLMGFDSKVDLDPVAASIAQASSVLRGTEKMDRWLSLYRSWARQI